jgi:hypothetical protein
MVFSVAAHHQQLVTADMKIIAADGQIQKAEEEVRKRQRKVDSLLGTQSHPQHHDSHNTAGTSSQKLTKSLKSLATAERKLEQTIIHAQSLSPGSGKVKIRSRR